MSHFKDNDWIKAGVNALSAAAFKGNPVIGLRNFVNKEIYAGAAATGSRK
ncbi:hypothetical protein [Ileibacterium valens]|nr:hypothetical protein [Ileibacterium valens]